MAFLSTMFSVLRLPELLSVGCSSSWKCPCCELVRVYKLFSRYILRAPSHISSLCQTSANRIHAEASHLRKTRTFKCTRATQHVGKRVIVQASALEKHSLPTGQNRRQAARDEPRCSHREPPTRQPQPASATAVPKQVIARSLGRSRDDNPGRYA